MINGPHKWFDFERKWLAVLLNTVIPGSQSFKPLKEVDDQYFWDQWNKNAPGISTLGLRVAIWYLNICAPLSQGKISPLTSQSEKHRDEILNSCTRSKWPLFGDLCELIKITATMLYFSDMQNQKAVRGHFL